MKDITAILFHYPESLSLYRALTSLQQIEARVTSIIVLQTKKPPYLTGSSKVTFISLANEDAGQLLNDILRSLHTTYVLFLHDSNYLSATTRSDSLYLPNSKAVLATTIHSRDSIIHHPVLVRTSLLKTEKLPHIRGLPFEEALLPAWLAKVGISQQSIRKDLLRKSKINRSSNRVQKDNIMEKYRLPKVKVKHASLSVVISTYNMEEYLETAVISCVLQNDAFDQILIMDDGSTDASFQKLKRLEDTVQIKVFHKKNEGKAKALNALLPYVTSDFVLELDADDWVDPDACSIIKKHFSGLPEEVAVLYGNLRKWKQRKEDVLFKGIAKGLEIKETSALLSYPFPLGPRIYRTATLIKEGGFPVIAFEDGRLYEDVSVLYQLLKEYPVCYKNFTVYNVREHKQSITRNNDAKWHDFLTILKSE